MSRRSPALLSLVLGSVAAPAVALAGDGWTAADPTDHVSSDDASSDDGWSGEVVHERVVRTAVPVVRHRACGEVSCARPSRVREVCPDRVGTCGVTRVRSVVRTRGSGFIPVDYSGTNPYRSSCAYVGSTCGVSTCGVSTCGASACEASACGASACEQVGTCGAVTAVYEPAPYVYGYPYGYGYDDPYAYGAVYPADVDLPDIDLPDIDLW